MKLDNILLGRTIVKVMQKNEKGDAAEIHRGVVVQDLGAFVRVFCNEDKSKGGDHDPICSELFAVESKRSWVEKTGELKEDRAIKIPVQFC